MLAQPLSNPCSNPVLCWLNVSTITPQSQSDLGLFVARLLLNRGISPLYHGVPPSAGTGCSRPGPVPVAHHAAGMPFGTMRRSARDEDGGSPPPPRKHAPEEYTSAPQTPPTQSHPHGRLRNISRLTPPISMATAQHQYHRHQTSHPSPCPLSPAPCPPHLTGTLSRSLSLPMGSE